jgi:hypothetical protein
MLLKMCLNRPYSEVCTGSFDLNFTHFGKISVPLCVTKFYTILYAKSV